ncbi:MAG: TolC family protein [Planctomycetota bacterium]|jgi:outer membrane protein TolC
MKIKPLELVRPALRAWPALLPAAASLAWLGGCASAMQRLDRRTTELLAETNADLGPEALTPRLSWTPDEVPAEPSYPKAGDWTDGQSPTVNPTAGQLQFTPSDEADNVIERLERYGEQPADALHMDLQAALAYAIRHSREYRFAEEEFLLAALRLLIERHLWGPRFFDDLEATITGDADDSTFDTALRLVNDLQVTQRLPYGGDVSARLLVQATEDLHLRVADERVQTADLIFSADVPLLRGAGQVAREGRVQAERDMVYAARGFERFRREFLLEITTEFLNLVVQQLAIQNTERQVQQLEDFESRDRALVEAGRQPPFEAALSEQSTLFARDRLNNQRESLRLSVDRFKVRLGMPEEQPLVIAPSTLGLPTPQLDMGEAVRTAMSYRLDLQNRRDQLDDAKRAVENARNALLADLNLNASMTIPTDDERGRAGLHFEPDDMSFRTGLILSLPLDREIERLNLRRSQITLERAIRSYEEFRDTVAVAVRAAVRNIDRARFSEGLQAENVRIAERRLASIEAAPDRASARDRSEAADDLLEAKDDYDGARRDLQTAILGYLLSSGQLRVDDDGSIRPLQGMRLRELEPGPAASPPVPEEAPP